MELEKRSVPEKVALVAMGDSRANYVADVTKSGSRLGVADEVWVINKLADCFVHDVLFRMDDLREPRKTNMKVISDRDNVIIHDRIDKVFREHPGPLITSKAYPEYPGSVTYPLEKVINHIGYSYFATTPAYAVAFASLIGVKHLALYGCDYSYPHNPGIAEEGRGNCEFMIAMAMCKGMKISVASKSSLLNQCLPMDEQFYGYTNLLEVKQAPPESEHTYQVVFRPDIEELRDSKNTLTEISTYFQLVQKYGAKTSDELQRLIEVEEKKLKEIEKKMGQKAVYG